MKKDNSLQVRPPFSVARLKNARQGPSGKRKFEIRGQTEIAFIVFDADKVYMAYGIRNHLSIGCVSRQKFDQHLHEIGNTTDVFPEIYRIVRGDLKTAMLESGSEYLDSDEAMEEIHWTK